MSKLKTGIIITGTLVLSISVSGCVSGPTYGTDKSSGQQMVDDFSNLFSFRTNKNSGIEVKPRPELVRPNEATKNNLPTPQQSVASAGSPDWPESPEQRRNRLRAEATANQNNPDYVSPITSSPGNAERYLSSGIDAAADRADRMPTQAVAKKQREEYLRRKKEASGGTATERKYLSEPPIAYRQPAATAPVNEQGPDEAQKERERKAKLGKKSSIWPF
ncbi:hypothetical protein [Bartonella sp. HY761]|uniref:hypothetical protein n=1 Tax=Bartonella sp. HY761 TaxID=2979330 RepID=UPI00220A5899|nr:hypothetical protein [Bartonella sp. HY761]UXN05824.1 hypothetical protein N6A79_11070 [Bartonella sp. HY761]